MPPGEPARTTIRRTRTPLIGPLLLVGVAVLVGFLVHQSLAPSSVATAGGVTPFEEDTSAVSRLDPDLLDALRRAATDASRQGIEVVVNSGWRSADDQERLLEDAIARYGSREEAARWVATPETSAHVSGDAVDVGPAAAAAWLSRYGAAYGLCQTYRNELWHFELHPAAVTDGCPPMYDDPTDDPRMQR